MAALQMLVEKVKRFENVNRVCQRQLTPICCELIAIIASLYSLACKSEVAYCILITIEQLCETTESHDQHPYSCTEQ